MVDGSLRGVVTVFWAALASADKAALAIGLLIRRFAIRLLHAVLDRIYPPSSGPPLDDGDKVVVWFDSSGLLLPYHIGVAEYLSERYCSTNICCVGISGGYAPASTLIMGVSAEEHWQAVQTLRRLGQKRWLSSFFFSSSEMIHHGYLPQLQPSERETLSKLAGDRMWIGASEIWPMPGRQVWTHRYQSSKHVCHACTCSMRTPPILRLPGRVDGALVVDGALACRPRSAPANLVRVSVFPSSLATISPQQQIGGARERLLPVVSAFPFSQAGLYVDCACDCARVHARVLMCTRGADAERPLP